ncbi:MAG TPA: hypothetical protein DCM40_45285, partial [Maribacter sp.]|nr:hypothetical protein [Maribacter sp.]
PEPDVGETDLTPEPDVRETDLTLDPAKQTPVKQKKQTLKHIDLDDIELEDADRQFIEQNVQSLEFQKIEDELKQRFLKLNNEAQPYIKNENEYRKVNVLIKKIDNNIKSLLKKLSDETNKSKKIQLSKRIKRATRERNQFSKRYTDKFLEHNKQFGKISQTEMYLQKFAQVFVEKTRESESEYYQTKGEEVDIPILGVESKTMQTISGPDFDPKNYIAVPDVLNLRDIDKDKVFEATKEVFERFPPRTISEYTKGKKELREQDIDDLIKKKAAEQADEVIRTTKVPAGTSLEEYRRKIIRLKSRLLWEQLYGVSLAMDSEKFAPDQPISANTMLPFIQKINNDPDALLAYSKFIFRNDSLLDNTSLAENYRLMKVAQTAGRQLNLHEPILHDATLAHMTDIKNLAQQTANLDLSFIESTKVYYDKFASVPESMKENLLNNVPDANRRQIAELVKSFDDVTMSRRDALKTILRRQEKSEGANQRLLEQVVSDTRKINSIGKEMSRLMYRKDLPMPVET